MKRYLILGIVLVFSFFVFSSVSESASLQSRIIGKWVSVDVNEFFKKIEFLKDGTIIVAIEDRSLAGDYKFIDENRIKMDLRLEVRVAELSFDKEGHLILTEFNKVTKYTTSESVMGLLLEEQWDKLKEMGKDAVEPLIAALKDGRWKVRANAAWMLGEIEDSRAVEPLIAALKDGRWEVRANAAWALGEIKDSRAVDPLIAALKDEDKEVRKNAIEALVKIGKDAVEPLIAALKDKYAKVRANAAWALGEIKDSRAVEPLIAALKDWWEVRKNAAEALKKLGK